MNTTTDNDTQQETEASGWDAPSGAGWDSNAATTTTTTEEAETKPSTSTTTTTPASSEPKTWASLLK